MAMPVLPEAWVILILNDSARLRFVMKRFT
jgi:hypothetical protein